MIPLIIKRHFLVIAVSWLLRSPTQAAGFCPRISPVRRSDDDSSSSLTLQELRHNNFPSAGSPNYSQRRLPSTTARHMNDVLMDYSPAATALFNNMKTPASILAAGMISIGFLAPFTLPPTILDQPKLIRRVELLKRAFTVVTLISFCSELLAVMWATVAVNQLTERTVEPASSVWELLQRDCDLSWAATNSHFVVGLVGFMYMVGIRGYLMLLAADASEALIASTMSGVASALLLMVSVVNRGVESGGGNGVGYGATVLDLFCHYVWLLYQRAVDVESFGPLELSAIVLELASVGYAIYALIWPRVASKGSNAIRPMPYNGSGQKGESINHSPGLNQDEGSTASQTVSSTNDE